MTTTVLWWIAGIVAALVTFLGGVCVGIRLEQRNTDTYDDEEEPW